ncbi:MAG TPA: hypothetical protein VLF38_13410 [Nocardioides sp.]|nr:hypothetical protein [Nocardioides sp.]
MPSGPGNAATTDEPRVVSISIAKIVTPVIRPATNFGQSGAVWARVKIVFEVPQVWGFSLMRAVFSDASPMAGQDGIMRYEGVDCTQSSSGTTVTLLCPVYADVTTGPGYYRSEKTVNVEYVPPGESDIRTVDLPVPTQPGGYLRYATSTRVDAAVVSTTDGRRVRLAGSVRRWLFSWSDNDGTVRWRPYRYQTVRFYFRPEGATSAVYVGQHTTNDHGVFVRRFMPRGRGTWIAKFRQNSRFAGSYAADRIG